MHWEKKVIIAIKYRVESRFIQSKECRLTIYRGREIGAVHVTKPWLLHWSSASVLVGIPETLEPR
jgi:hypothetical protein